MHLLKGDPVTANSGQLTGSFHIGMFRYHLIIRKPYGYPIAFVLYLAVSLIYFGLPVLSRSSESYIGSINDSFSFMWWLYWWPYAIARGLNPFLTQAVWAPVGYNLAWATGIPGLSFIAAPFTFTLGPVAAYNILMLLSPILAAFTAYVLLFHLTGKFWPSLIGGFIFGFSSYEIGHLMGHLNLAFICMIPLCVYLTLLLFENKIGTLKFIVFMGLTLFFQFLISTEVFATMTLLGVLILILAVIISPDVRHGIISKGKFILAAYGLAVVLLSPYLYYVFAFGYPTSPINLPSDYSAELLNLFLPTEITFIGQSQFYSVTALFSGNNLENGAYIGLPLLLVILIYFMQFWRTRTGKLLILSLCVIILASFGPILHIHGVKTIQLPWLIFAGLPLINQALPARFMAFGFLIIALITALFLTNLGAKRLSKAAGYGLVVLGIVFLIPNLPGGYWHKPATTPAFFSQGIYRNYLDEGDTVIIFPYGYNGKSMLWQAETGMYFDMAGGYVGLTPEEFTDWPIVHTFYSGVLIPDYENELKRFLISHGVDAVIIENSASSVFFQLFESLDVRSQKIGGVTLYQIP